MLDYPAKLIPSCKDYIWGGTLLKDRYNKGAHLDKVAEAWEMSCHPNGLSVIANGPQKGVALSDAVCDDGSFPLLVKLIDAQSKLSVQVHPDDEYAANLAGRGKTEMWYILDAEPGAEIVYGFCDNMTPEAVKEHILSERLEQLLNYIPVCKGDVIHIPAGTVHAIGSGILILEIQQSSDLTFRLYDYGRVGADGKPRPLHIEQALDVLDYAKARFLPSNHQKKTKNGLTYMLVDSCEYFTVYKLILNGKWNYPRFDQWKGITVIQGGGEINWIKDSKPNSLEICEGDTVYLPFGLNCCFEGQLSAVLYGSD